MRIHYYYLLIFLFALISCGKSKSQLENEKYGDLKVKKELVSDKNQAAISKLANVHNSLVGWDTSRTYTYNLQDLISSKNQPLSFQGELKDIVKADSGYLLKVHTTGYKRKQNYIAQVYISSENFKDFINVLNAPNRSSEGCFIINVSKIIAASPLILTGVEYSDEFSYSTLEYDFDEKLILIKGELIDFYLNEIIVNNE